MAEAAETKLERTQRTKDLLEKSLSDLRSAQATGRIEFDPMRENMYEQRIQHLADLIPRYQQQVADFRDVHSKLNKLGSEAVQNPFGFLQELETDQGAASLLYRVKPLRDLQQAALDLMTKKSEISRALSPNIGNDKSFLMEYITDIAGRPETDIKKARWMLNPQNASKLSQVLYDPKYTNFAQKIMQKRFGQEQIERGQIPKELLDLANRTPDSIAKKLGITLAAAAALIPMLKIFSWFNSEKVHQEAVGTLDDLDNFKAVGMGKVLLDNVKAAINAMNKARTQAEAKMGSADAKTALANYVESMGRVKNVLDKVLPRWNEVVRNADQPEMAKNAGMALERLRAELDTNLDTLGSQVPEVPITGEKPADAPRAAISRQNILDIQEYLSSKNPYIGTTGILDKETINTLRELEQNYNRIGNTDRFTGLLIDTAKNHLAPADDLRFIEKEMSKYR